jgi:hypothetical protein
MKVDFVLNIQKKIAFGACGLWLNILGPGEAGFHIFLCCKDRAVWNETV